MQNENPTSIASDRPSLQQQQQQNFGGDDIKSKSGIVNSSSSSSSKHSTHQHHREDDPVVGSFMGLRVEEQRPQNESDSDIRGSSEIKVEDAGRDESQQGGAQDVQGSEQSAVDKSSIFDRDGSQGSQEDLSKGIGMAHGFGGYSEIGHHKRQQEQQEQELQGQDQGQESGVSESSDIGQQLNASQDWFKPSEAGETSVDLSDKIGEQQNVSQDLSLSSNAGRGFDLGQQQEGGGDSSSRSNQPDQDWSVGSQASSSVGQSSVDNFDLSQQQQQQQPSGISDIGQQQSDRVGQDWAQSSAFGQFPQQQQQQQQQQSVGSSDLQGVDASRWPQNQGVWNPGLQGDSSSADKDISSQYDASGILIRSSDLGQTVSQDKGPYALDIQDQGKQQDEDRQPQEQQLSAGSESQPLLGSQDAGDFSYGSTASGYGQGLSNPGADSQQQQQQDEERQWNVQDFGKGDLRDQSQLAGDEDAAGFSQQSNVQDFGKGDLRDQSQLSGDKATFQHDAEEKPAGDDDHWRRVGDRQFVGEGEDRVHGMAREDFI